jgi:5'(3')-deoxyribonucleotidase
MFRIAVDMDEVIADAMSEYLNRYNKRFGTEIQHADLHGKQFHEVIPPEHRQTVFGMVNAHDFFANLAVMPGAQDSLRRLCSEHEVFITSAAMEVPASFEAKYRWLLLHFPFISPMNFVFCGDKSIIRADYLIDDNPRHFKKFVGTGILFDAPHNREIKGYSRVHNWNEVEQFIAAEKVASHSESKAAKNS